MLRRFAPLLVVIGVSPLMVGAGGFNPPSFTPQIGGPEFTAVIQLDPHMTAGDPRPGDPSTVQGDITTTAKQASIRLFGPIDKRKGAAAVSQAEFRALPDFALFRGCDLGVVSGPNIPRTELRFLYTPANQTTLRAWVPQASLEFLFRPHGITVSDTNIPVITAINNVTCVADARNPGPIADGGDGSSSGSVAGILLMDVTIRFISP